jgi:hypothetical protein
MTSGGYPHLPDRFTFTLDPADSGERRFRMRCADCPEPVDEWLEEQAEYLLTPSGEGYLREVAADHERSKHPGDGAPLVPAITPGEVLVPAAWCLRYGMTMHSRDGWRDRPWTDAVTLPEFARRARRCTQDLRAWVRFLDLVPEDARQ